MEEQKETVKKQAKKAKYLKPVVGYSIFFGALIIIVAVSAIILLSL